MNRLSFGGIGQLLSAAMAAACFWASPALARCVGDCNDDATVSIDELSHRDQHRPRRTTVGCMPRVR